MRQFVRATFLCAVFAAAANAQQPDSVRRKARADSIAKARQDSIALQRELEKALAQPSAAPAKLERVVSGLHDEKDHRPFGPAPRHMGPCCPHGMAYERRLDLAAWASMLEGLLPFRRPRDRHCNASSTERLH